jgi:CRP/FNR family transcriptional regulator, anaerobic regulatory protein
METADLDRLNAIVSVTHLAPQQALFLEGDRADNIFNVTAGTMRLSKMMPDGRRQVTGFLIPGDFLGVAFNAIYAYTAEAITLANLCRFPRLKLEGLLDDFPALERRLLGIASNELVAAQDQMLLLGRKSAQEKIASFIVMLSRRAVRHGRPANPIDLPMTRVDIADYLGLTMETVSRTFTQLRKDGIIALPRGQVELVNMDRLEELAAS